jgi:hypothetical protein
MRVLRVRRWRELVIHREKKERYCSTGQSPQRAVAPVEEDDEEEVERDLQVLRVRRWRESVIT